MHALASCPAVPIVKTIASTTAIEPSLCGRVWAVVLKRATYVWRQKKIPLFSWLLPPLMLSLLFFLEYVSLRGSGQDVEHVGDTVRYTFHELIGHTQGFIIVDEHEHFMETWFMPLIANPEQFYVVKVTKGGGITASLLSVAKETLRKYVFNIHFGVQMTEKDGNALWYNGQIQHLAPLVLNLFNTARLRNVTKDESADFIFEVTSRGVTDAQVAQHSRSGHDDRPREREQPVSGGAAQGPAFHLLPASVEPDVQQLRHLPDSREGAW
ncbi:hypothetical protein MRX96_052577, partial [Rhipicephalus microplus]